MSGSTCHCGGARGCSCIGMHMPWWCNTVLMYATASPVQAPIAYIADWLLSFWCSSIREARHPSLPPLFPPSLPHSLPPGQGRRNCYIYGHYGLDRSTFRPKKIARGIRVPARTSHSSTYIYYVRNYTVLLLCSWAASHRETAPRIRPGRAILMDSESSGPRSRKVGQCAPTWLLL